VTDYIGTSISLEKPSLDDIKHYGVLGMRWGSRKGGGGSSSGRTKGGKRDKRRKSLGKTLKSKLNKSGKGWTSKTLVEKQSLIRKVAWGLYGANMLRKVVPMPTIKNSRVLKEWKYAARNIMNPVGVKS